jgi:membrane protease YdiL (CAAX protease family)
VDDVSTPPSSTPEPGRMDPLLVTVAATALAFAVYLVTSLTVLLNVPFGLWFTQLFAFLGVGWYVLRATGRQPVRYMGLGAPRLAPVAFGFAVGVANLFAIATPLQYVSQAVMPVSWREIYNVAEIFRGQSALETAFVVGGVGVLGPLCEEFFFRGLFLQGARSRGGPAWRMLVFSAVVFSFFHLDPVGFLARVELGVLFGWMLLRTGSLWPSILAHMANNLTSTVLFFVARQTGVFPETSPREELLSVMGISLVGLLALLGLWAAARRFPALLGGPPPPREALEAPEPPIRLEPLTRLMWLAVPWVLGATLVLGAYLAVDRRAIPLFMVDQDYPLAAVPKTAPDARHAERAALFELRQKARRGEIPIEEYIQERARQSTPKPKVRP